MTDDLITRLRAILAEVEHRLGGDVSPKLAQALSTPAVGADVGAEPSTTFNLPDKSNTYRPSMADATSDIRARDFKPKDYVPRDLMHEEGFDPEDFIGSGDRDPLGHEALIRSR